jgi:hypothetical protein
LKNDLILNIPKAEKKSPVAPPSDKNYLSVEVGKGITQ